MKTSFVHILEAGPIARLQNTQSFSFLSLKLHAPVALFATSHIKDKTAGSVGSFDLFVGLDELSTGDGITSKSGFSLS